MPHPIDRSREGRPDASGHGRRIVADDYGCGPAGRASGGVCPRTRPGAGRRAPSRLRPSPGGSAGALRRTLPDDQAHEHRPIGRSGGPARERGRASVGAQRVMTRGQVAAAVVCPSPLRSIIGALPRGGNRPTAGSARRACLSRRLGRCPGRARGRAPRRAFRPPASRAAPCAPRRPRPEPAGRRGRCARPRVAPLAARPERRTRRLPRPAPARRSAPRGGRRRSSPACRTTFVSSSRAAEKTSWSCAWTPGPCRSRRSRKRPRAAASWATERRAASSPAASRTYGWRSKTASRLTAVGVVAVFGPARARGTKAAPLAVAVRVAGPADTPGAGAFGSRAAVSAVAARGADHVRVCVGCREFKRDARVLNLAPHPEMSSPSARRGSFI